MQSLANYSDNDQELYIDFNVQQAQHELVVSTGTVASTPDKPNEDAHCVLESDGILIAGIFDGATSLRPILKLKNQSGARFASHFLKDTLRSIDNCQPLTDVMIELNERLLTANSMLGGLLSDVHSLPASTATLITISKNVLSFAHVGDTFGVVYFKDGSSNVFTSDTNEKFDKRVLTLLKTISDNKKISPRDARNDALLKEALFETARDKNNNPNGRGSGIVNGDPNITKYIQAGTIDLAAVDTILLGTDGMIPPGWSIQRKHDRDKLRELIEKNGITGLFTVKHEIEDNDPNWHKLRFKHSDDATVVFINIVR